MLVFDAVEHALGHRDVPAWGDVEADLEALVRMVYESLVANPIGWALPGIGIDLMRQPELALEYRRRFVDPIREQAVVLIRRGMAEGIFGRSVEPEAVVDAVAGSILYRRIVGDPPPSLENLLAVTRAVLRP